MQAALKMPVTCEEGSERFGRVVIDATEVVAERLAMKLERPRAAV